MDWQEGKAFVFKLGNRSKMALTHGNLAPHYITIGTLTCAKAGPTWDFSGSNSYEGGLSRVSFNKKNKNNEKVWMCDLGFPMRTFEISMKTQIIFIIFISLIGNKI